MSNLLLNLDDFVRVTQTTGKEINGRYDGVEYTFPSGHPVDCHKAVAVHLFGFGLPEESADAKVQDKTSALLRLGWVNHTGDKRDALTRLRTQVKFEEIPPFPTVLRLKHVEEDSGELQMESASRVPSSPPLGGGGGQSTAAPADPRGRQIKDGTR